MRTGSMRAAARVVALPGLGLAWHAAGDVVTGQTLGGPIPGRRRRRRRRR